MKTRHHIGIDVKQALSTWCYRDFAGAFKRPDGTRLTAAEAREALVDELAKGHEMIPMVECDNWDWKTGCKGHPIEDGTK